MRIYWLPLLLSTPALSQWLHVTTAGVPRRADGSPDLTAPAPKTAGGKPDFSGMWVARDELPCNAKERGVQCTELALTPQVVNIAAGLKDGLPYQPWAAELVKTRKAELGVNDPHTHCMPPNYPRAWAFPEYQKIFQTPGELVLLHEFNASYRQIFFDGRGFPDDMAPAWSGYSVAHWEPDTLVVESRGFRDDNWLDTTGNPMTSAARVMERIRRPNFGSLEIEITVNDPKAYTRPWTVTMHEKALVDTEMIDFMCLENNKDIAHMKGSVKH
ncbi:MAG TPA: hypothetical protein VH640_04910 [Bryobacteraceae bacterium]